MGSAARAGRRLVAIDVGSNTVLAAIIERNDDGGLAVLADLERVVGLGRGVDATGALAHDRIDAALAALEAHLAEARARGVHEARAVGTSALRDATNRARFVELARTRLGLDLEVISGAREAALTFRGALVGLDATPAGQPYTVFDVGGGSTELARGSGGVASATASLDVGAVRLSERHLRAPRATTAEVRALRDDVEAALLPHRHLLEGPLVALAGTATTLAALALGHARHDAAAVHGATLSREALTGVVDRLVASSVDERMSWPAVEPGRERTVVGGALIVEAVVLAAGVDHVRVSDGGVRFGLALEALDPTD